MNGAEKMVEEIKVRYGLDSPQVFSAMRQVLREKFVPSNFSHLAYEDRPVSIGYGQTISQPYTVAFMTHLLVGSGSGSRRPRKKVLEIGTGSGYQAAILSSLFGEVYSVERISQLAEEAKIRLRKLGYKNVYVKAGSGEFGWKAKSPFDAIIVTAGIEDGITPKLSEQLKEGGVMVVPIGKGPDKKMTKFIKKGSLFVKKEYGIFQFVPFIENN